MSFILDALRRAEAERQRGTTPGLHQLPLNSPSSPANAGRPVWPWVLAALQLVAVAAAVGWWWLARPVPQPVAAAAPRADAASASATLPAAAWPRPAPSASPPSVPVATPPVTKAPPRPPAVQAPPPGTAATTAPTPEAHVSVAAPAPASTPSAGPLAAHALPEPLRGAVMRLQVGGVVHSQDRSQSFVLVGGQIAREGDTLAPGITLEHITPRWLLLRVAGQLVSLPL